MSAVLMQIPNFILAGPILYLSCMGCWAYFNCNWGRAFSLGLQTSQPTQCQQDGKHTNASKSSSVTASPIHTPSAVFTHDKVAPYIYHWALLTACALFIMNVQVATRYAVVFLNARLNWKQALSIEIAHAIQLTSTLLRVSCIVYAGSCPHAQLFTGILHL